MTKRDITDNTDIPLTVASLTNQLRACGLAEGQTVIVHMAMSKLGYVIGGSQAVIMALLAAVGETGTIMMVTNSDDNSEPSLWQDKPVHKSWWQPIRDHTPAYDALTTPTRSLGRVPELFRVWPGTIRSTHPALSMAARGPNAEFLTADHVLAEGTGEHSPLGRLYELDGHILLLGVDHWNNTSLHYAEFRADYPGKRNLSTGSAMLVNGHRRWVTYEMVEGHPEDFGSVVIVFDRAHKIPVHKINDAEVRFFRQRPLVDFAVNWMEQHRDFTV